MLSVVLISKGSHVRAVEKPSELRTCREIEA